MAIARDQAMVYFRARFHLNQPVFIERHVLPQTGFGRMIFPAALNSLKGCGKLLQDSAALL